MASYTINDETYNSFEELAKNAYRKERGYLLALTKRRDKFLNDPDESVRSAAELIKRHDQGDISNEDFMFETILTHSFIQFMLTIYIHIHIRHMDCRDISNNFSAVVNANIDPDDAERWGDKPKKKPYSEYTDDEKMACIKRLAEQGYREDLLSDENREIRQIAWTTLGREETAKRDTYWRIRLDAYRALGWNEEAKKDSDPDVRRAAYRALGRDETAKQDKDGDLRSAAYRALGRDETAKQDDYRYNRREAYRALGRNESAKQDDNWEIRKEAYRALGWDEVAKQDDNWEIRKEAYYALGREEKAKEDSYWEVRREAYRALGRTKEALEDEDVDICREAKLYYDTVGKRADE